MFAAMAFGMLSWRRLLDGLGSPIPVTSAGRIYFVGQLGKYLPGSVWPMVSQMELGKDHAIPRRRSVSALLIALLLSLTTGVLIGAVTLPFLLGHAHRWLWLLLALVPVLLTLLYPRVLWPILGRIPKLDLKSAIGTPMPERTMLAAVGWSMLGWVTYGLHVALLTTAFTSHDLGRVLLVSIGGYALAWCAGMIAFVLPAGAGARDLALILALSTVTSSNTALAVAVVSRAVTTLVDLSWAALAIAGMRQVRRTG
jgi:glycosyltransferase 2 family protein